MKRIIGFIEDPGATNGMVGLSDELQQLGISLELYASGAALAYAPGIGIAVTPTPEDVLQLFKADKPDALLVGTSENPDAASFAMIDAARDAGIPSVGFVDGPANAEHRFRGRSEIPLTHLPDTLLVSDPLARDVYVDLGVHAKAVHVVGHPNMDRVRARKAELDLESKATVRARLFPDIDTSSPLVLFAAEISDGLDQKEFMRNIDYTLHGSGECDGRTEICLEEVIAALKTCDGATSLAVRLHPKNTRSTFDPFKDDINALSVGGDPLEVIYAADIVIGMTSVLLFEAAVMGLPTVSVTPRKQESSWLTSIGLGLTRHVCTRAALRDTLQTLMLNPAAFVTPNIDVIVPPGAASRIAAHLARVMTAKADGQDA